MLGIVDGVTDGTDDVFRVGNDDGMTLGLMEDAEGCNEYISVGSCDVGIGVGLDVGIVDGHNPHACGHSIL